MFPIVSCCILIADLWPIWPGLGWGMRRPTMAAIWDGHHLNVPCIGRQVIRLHHGCNKPCEIRQCYCHCITVVFQMVRLDILSYIMHINVLYNFNETTYILCFYGVSPCIILYRLYRLEAESIFYIQINSIKMYKVYREVGKTWKNPCDSLQNLCHLRGPPLPQATGRGVCHPRGKPWTGALAQRLGLQPCQVHQARGRFNGIPWWFFQHTMVF